MWYLIGTLFCSHDKREEIEMKNKKLLALMATLAMATVLSACGAESKESTEDVAKDEVESVSTQETDMQSETEENTQVEQTEEETTQVDLKESIAYNYEYLGFNFYYEQALEAAYALDELGFGKIQSMSDEYQDADVIVDENGKELWIYTDTSYYYMITEPGGEPVLWEWEMTDKYEKERFRKLKEQKLQELEENKEKYIEEGYDIEEKRKEIEEFYKENYGV